MPDKNLEEEIAETLSHLVVLYERNQQYDEALGILRREDFFLDEKIRETATKLYNQKITSCLQEAEQKVQDFVAYKTRQEEIYAHIDLAQKLVMEARKKKIKLMKSTEEKLETAPPEMLAQLAEKIFDAPYWGLAISVLKEAADRGIVPSKEEEIRKKIASKEEDDKARARERQKQEKGKSKRSR